MHTEDLATSSDFQITQTEMASTPPGLMLAESPPS